MNDPHQIAAEVTRKLMDDGLLTDDCDKTMLNDVTSRIQAVIEKGVIAALRKYEGKCPICGAAHASGEPPKEFYEYQGSVSSYRKGQASTRERGK